MNEIFNQLRYNNRESGDEFDEYANVKEIEALFENLEKKTRRQRLDKAIDIAGEKIIKLENLSFGDHVDNAKEKNKIYVTHQTSNERLVGIVVDNGILINPQDKLGTQPFICQEIYTHALLKDLRTGEWFEGDISLNNKGFPTIIQRDRRYTNSETGKEFDNLIRQVRVKEDEMALSTAFQNQRRSKSGYLNNTAPPANIQNNILYKKAMELDLKKIGRVTRFKPDSMEILQDDFPDFYNLIKEKMSFLKEAYPDVFYFEDYGDDFFWMRKTKAEFVVSERDREIENTCKQIVDELYVEYKEKVLPKLPDDLRDNYTLYDFREAVDERISNSNSESGIWNRVRSFFAKGSVVSPTYYGKKFEGPTILLELDDSLIDIKKAREGDFNTKACSFFTITSSDDFKLPDDKLPLKYIKGVILYNNYEENKKETVELLKKTFTVYPNRAFPIYDIDGKLVWPQMSASDKEK